MPPAVQTRIIWDILKQSYQKKLGHIPSALSWMKMLYEVFTVFNTEDNIFIFGKFWGSQALYAVLRELQIQDTDNFKDLSWIWNLNYETIGDTLGYACGVSMMQDKPVLCLMSDSCLQSGYVYEALEYIVQHSLNLKLLVDDNHSGVIGKTENCLSLRPLREMLCGLGVYHELDPNTDNHLELLKPGFQVYFYQSTKGDGVLGLQDPKWHYKLLDTETYQRLVKSL